VLAFTHPYINSSGHHGGGGTYDKMKPIVKELYSAGATLLVTGHDHHLEQFKKQNAQGQADPARGIRTFIVGTGGAKLYEVALNDQKEPVRKHRLSEKFANTSKGFLKLKLYRDGYEWSFVAVTGVPVELPVGREACNRAPV
jgi:acid phosphatase type 7